MVDRCMRIDSSSSDPSRITHETCGLGWYGCGHNSRSPSSHTCQPYGFLLLHQVCLQLIPCGLIDMYWAKCKQSNSYTSLRTLCSHFRLSWLSMPTGGHGDVICMCVWYKHIFPIQLKWSEKGIKITTTISGVPI